MANENNTIQQIYDFRSFGLENVVNGVASLNALLIEVKKNKVALNSVKSTIEDPVELAKINQQLIDLKVLEKELQVELKQKQIDAKEMQILRQKELNDQRAQISGNQALKGSYNDLNKQYRELLNISKNTTNLNNPAEVAEAVAELTKLKSVLDNFNRSLTADKTLVGEYTTGIINAFKKLGLQDIIISQIEKAKTEHAALNAQVEKLAADFAAAKAAGTSSLEQLERELLQNRTAAAQLETEIARMETTLSQTGRIGEQITSALSAGFKNLKQDVVNFFIGYLGFQAVLSGIHETIGLNRELSDTFAQLKIYIHGTDQDVENLVASLKKIDTRTSLTGLADIATIVAKKGVAKEEIAGITEALDRLFVVLGKEIGDPHEAVQSLVKLVNVYSEDKHVTAKNIEDIGAAIYKLTSSGVATGDFLISFAERLAGVRGITGVSIQNVLGLGAAIQELGQRSEVAGTAASQLIIKLFTDIPKYATFAGKSVQEFTKTVTENPVEALIQLAEGLKNNKQGLDEVAQAFDAAGIHGARVLGVLGDIAGNADYMRKRVVDANRAFGDQAAVMDAAAIKQDTFSATLDRIKKQFELIASNKGVQITITLIAGAVFLLANNLGVIITLLGSYATIWGIANYAQIAAKATTIASNIAFKAQYAALVINELWIKAYAAALTLYVNRQEAATTAAILFSEVLTENPLGVFLVLLGLLIAGITAFDAKIFGTTEHLKEHARQLTAIAQANAKAAEMASEHTSKLEILYKVVNNTNNSLDTRKKALDELIKLSPKFSEAINGEIINLGKLKTAYDEVRKSILLTAGAQASAQLASDKQKGVLQVTALRQKIETESSIQGSGTVSIGNLTSDELALLNGAINETSVRYTGNNGIQFLAADTEKIKAILSREEKKRTDIYKSYIDVASKKQAELNEYNAQQDKLLQDSLQNKAESGSITVQELKQMIEAIDKENLGLDIHSKKLKDNITKREQLQKELDDALDKTKTHASHLDAGTQDQFKDVDAWQKKQQTALETAYQEEDNTRKYYNSIFIGDERTYITQLEKINEDAINKKLSTLTGKNAEERKVMADLHLQLITDKKKTNDKLYQLDFENLQNQKQALENTAKGNLDNVEGDPTATDAEKAAAKQNYYSNLLNIQQAFNEAADLLELQYNKKSEKNEADRQKALQSAKSAYAKAALNTIQSTNKEEEDEIYKQFENRINDIMQKVFAKSKAIYGSNDSAKTKSKKVQDLKDDTADDVFKAEQDRLDKLQDLYKFQLDNNLISLADYNKKVDKLNEDRFNSYQKWNQKQVSDEEKTRQRKEAIITGAENILQTFAQGYIDNQNKIIDKNIDEAESFNNKEKDKREALATSSAEKQAIEDEYAQKQAALEKQRNEEKKEIAKKQLAIEFALASVKAIDQALSIPGAGWVDALAAEAIVAGEYAAKLLVIENQQFAMGGKLTRDGGRADGKRHGLGGTPFSYGGSSLEAEADELFIVNRNSALSNENFTVSGTPSQIASAINAIGGGIDFAPGASLNSFDYGGTLGASLHAPVLNKGEDQYSEMLSMIAMQYGSLNALAQTVLNIQVSLDTNAAAKKMDNNRKAVQLGKI